MPGIAGIIGKAARGRYESELKLMLDCTMHESFYRKGFYTNKDLGVYVGWTCHPGSYADCMPVINERKDLILLFTGENFSGLTDGKSERASGLLRQYEIVGEKFLRGLNGWFSGLLVDLRTGNILLFNDRYGMQRVYYYEGESEFLFGSEAKSLLKVRPELRRLDTQAVGELISCNCVLNNRTLFQKISVLPGGSAWTWDKRGELCKNIYFQAIELFNKMEKVKRK